MLRTMLWEDIIRLRELIPYLNLLDYKIRNILSVFSLKHSYLSHVSNSFIIFFSFSLFSIFLSNLKLLNQIYFIIFKENFI